MFGQQKLCSPFLASLCAHLQVSIPLGVYGLNLIPTTIWVGVVINGVLIIITID
jgi:hypothetical protein